jgi:hypothetical protein
VTGGHHPRCTVEYRTEVIPVTQFGLAGRQPHPHRQFQFALRGYGSIHRCPWWRECGAHTIAGVLEQPTAVRLDRFTQYVSCAAMAARMALASASHRRVDPSTSVNKNVTAPDGAAAADTLTGFHKQRSPTPNIGGSSAVTGYTCFETNFRESHMSSVLRYPRAAHPLAVNLFHD